MSGSKNDNNRSDQNKGLGDEKYEFVEKSTLENLLPDVNAEHAEELVELTHAESDQDGSVMLCPKCGADKLAKSRTQGLDGLITRFVARRPYRCLRCYHRFWRQEKFSADSRRIWSWALLLLMVALFVLIKSQSIQQFFSQAGDVGDRPALSSDPPKQANNVFGGQQAKVSKESSQTGRFSRDDSQNNQASLNPNQQSLDGYAFQGPDTQPLSAGELQVRLEQAKRKEKRVEQVNQLKQAELVSQLSAQPAEIESLLRLDINYRIEQWRKAWQQGDSGRYLDLYSSEFKPHSGLSYSDWREQRYQKVLPERNIKLELSDFEVIFSQEYQRATVEFSQRYQSYGFVEQSRKELLLIKVAEQWFIVSEREIGS